MILYFTGTGNSEFVAKRIAEAVNDEAINLLEKLRNQDYSEINSDLPFVIVAPTYAWKLPILVEEWLGKTELKGNKDIYFVLTCGSSIGGAGKFAQNLAKAKSMNYKGLAKVVMPENYIAMFRAPEENEAKRIIRKSLSKIDAIIEAIKNNESIEDRYTKADVVFSKIINDGFVKLYITDQHFKRLDRCIGCGKCERVCPKDNIEMVDGKPVWKGDCTHCMACICGCPVETIEFGFISKNKVRYNCPKFVE